MISTVEIGRLFEGPANWCHCQDDCQRSSANFIFCKTEWEWVWNLLNYFATEKWQPLWFSNSCKTLFHFHSHNCIISTLHEPKIAYWFLWKAATSSSSLHKTECPHQKQNYMKRCACLVKDLKRYILFYFSASVRARYNKNQWHLLMCSDKLRYY